VGHGNKRSSSIAQCINGGKLEILNLLVKAHADVNAPNGGRLPLSIAALEDRLDFVKGLLDAGADPNRQSCDGYTPLSCAIAAARFEIVEMLVKAGANVNSVNPETGETALDIAVDQKRVNRRDPAIAAYLRRAGAKHAKDLGSLPENQDSEVDWQLRHDAVLTATLEPWPPKQGSVCINVEVTTADEQTQIVESVGCRVATTQENSEDWKPMEMTGVEENGSVHFKYSVSMAKGASYIQFRVRDQVDRKPQDLTDWKVDVE